MQNEGPGVCKGYAGQVSGNPAVVEDQVVMLLVLILRTCAVSVVRRMQVRAKLLTLIYHQHWQLKLAELLHISQQRRTPPITTTLELVLAGGGSLEGLPTQACS